MPGPGSSRHDTKTELLYHARTLFAQHGYEGVSMRDIAGAVGIRQSAIYNHFSGKQELLVELMTRHMERLLTAMRAATRPGGLPTARLETFARFHVAYHMDHPDDVFLAYMELRSLGDEGRAAVLPLRRAYEKELHEILDEGVKTGVFRTSDTAVTARALLAMLTGVTVWFRTDGRLSADEVADAYVKTALQAVGAART